LPVSISDHIGVTAKRFDQTGAFDAVLDIDSRLFIDPHLLKNTRVPELSGSYGKVKKRFADVLKILRASKAEGDKFWRAAFDLFYFPELGGLCIGYSGSGTDGNGMGKALRTKILRTAKEIVSEGILDPEIFELVGLFEENVGADRISDMVGRIIVDDLQKYTQRVLDSLKAKTVPVPKSSFKSIINPFSKSPVILVPAGILRDLPIARDWSEIDLVCEFNDALRRKVNALVGDTWKRATGGRKDVLRSVILAEPDLLRDLVSLYKKKPAVLYDYKTDPSGEVIWLRASRNYVKDFPLNVTLPPKPSAKDVLKVVFAICNKFKDLIENNGLSSLLYDKATKPKKEEAAQKIFFGVADSYCSANNLDLTPEANGGRGLGGRPKPAICGHLKTGQMRSSRQGR
jgi:hypothetical protein